MSMLRIKQIKAYNFPLLVYYLIVRWKVYIGELQRGITEEFGVNDIKANHYLFMKRGKVIGAARILYQKYGRIR